MVSSDLPRGPAPAVILTSSDQNLHKTRVQASQDVTTKTSDKCSPIL